MTPLPVLGEAGFEDALRRLGRVVVMFTADWCPHCRRFAPVFEEAARRHPDLRFAIADVSDDDTDARWDRYRIAVVPSVLLFVEGREAARLDGVLGRGIAPSDLHHFVQAALSAPA